MIFKITTITGSADTAIETTFDMRSFHKLLNAAGTLTCSHTNGNVVASTNVVFTCTGTNAAETQDNVNRLQAWFGDLMAKSHLGNIHSKVYVMNLASIIADAGLVFTGATTSPLTTTVVA
jgi:hypothetical protein